jgi:uncharacterized membrane protein YidH (DUF202 family)
MFTYLKNYILFLGAEVFIFILLSKLPSLLPQGSLIANSTPHYAIILIGLFIPLILAANSRYTTQKKSANAKESPIHKWLIRIIVVMLIVIMQVIILMQAVSH